MLFLLFELGRDRYALDVRQIVKILPLVELKKIPQAPQGVAGVFNYHGEPTPVIDLNEFTLGRSAQAKLSTRIILANYLDGNGGKRRLGLIAEKATDTLRREAADFSPSGVTNDGTPYLGPVTTDTQGVIQQIEVERLLPASIRNILFKEQHVS